jgi:hypothetical protein
LIRFFLATLTLLCCSFTLGEAAPAYPVTYSHRVVHGASLHIIDANLNDRRVVVAPALAQRGIGRSETFSHFVNRLRPTAAINGTFFSKRGLKPVADIVVDGELRHFGGMGTALALSRDGVDFIRLPKSRRVDWSGYQAALAGGPLLVWEGFAKPRPGGEGFGDPHVFARAAPRTAMAITKYNHLLLVTTARGCSLGKLALALRDLGAVYAVNLDGGSSQAMYYRGRMIVGAKRPLTNVLCVYVKPSPIAETKLRPPRGVDWRTGHTARPSLAFAAGTVKIQARLPRKWEGEESVLISSNQPLPAGASLLVKLDDNVIATVTALPAEVPLNLTRLPGPKHQLWLGVQDAEGTLLGRIDRIFKPGTAGNQAW